jgi:hypothetical protein
MRTSLLRQYIGCLANYDMSKGLGAILSTGDSLSANAQELQIVPGAVLGDWDCPSMRGSQDGFCGFSGLSRAVVSRLRIVIVSSRICCTSYTLVT